MQAGPANSVPGLGNPAGQQLISGCALKNPKLLPTQSHFRLQLGQEIIVYPARRAVILPGRAAGVRRCSLCGSWDT
jgi:hypothetical protein